MMEMEWKFVRRDALWMRFPCLVLKARKAREVVGFGWFGRSVVMLMMMTTMMTVQVGRLNEYKSGKGSTNGHGRARNGMQRGGRGEGDNKTGFQRQGRQADRQQSDPKYAEKPQGK